MADIKTCQECGNSFQPKRESALGENLFCSRVHKDAFYNRCAKRGKVLVPLLLGWQGERRAKAGSEGADQATWARRQVTALADKWNAEDKAAGRKPMGRILAGKMDRRWEACDLEGGE